MPIEQYTYWSVTINNPTETDYVLIRNPNDKYVRSLVWTPEVGEEGTEHIQAWIRLQRNQTLSFMKRLYPRAHLKPCDKDAYNENCHQYAQKNDETTAGNHHITLNDPLPASDTLLYQVIWRAFESIPNIDEKILEYSKDVMTDKYTPRYLYARNEILNVKMLDTPYVEKQMVLEKSGLEKMFTSPAYERMKQKFWKEILLRLIHNDDARIAEETKVETREGTESQSYEDSDCETYEDESEGSDSGFSEETDRSEN